eukprot:6210492-Pleurochrysis_carterae.AAC.2
MFYALPSSAEKTFAFKYGHLMRGARSMNEPFSLKILDAPPKRKVQRGRSGCACRAGLVDGHLA